MRSCPRVPSLDHAINVTRLTSLQESVGKETRAVQCTDGLDTDDSYPSHWNSLTNICPTNQIAASLNILYFPNELLALGQFIFLLAATFAPLNHNPSSIGASPC